MNGDSSEFMHKLGEKALPSLVSLYSCLGYINDLSACRWFRYRMSGQTIYTIMNGPAGTPLLKSLRA